MKDGSRVDIRQADQGDGQRPQKKQNGKHRLQPLQQRFVNNKQKSRDSQGCDRYHHFTDVNLMPCHSIMKSPLQRIPEQGPAHHKESRCIQEHDRQVGKAQKPGA